MTAVTSLWIKEINTNNKVRGDANKAQGEAECFVGIKASRWMLYFTYIGRTRPCFNCFKEFIHERLVKAYRFQSVGCPLTLSSQVRWFWIISRITDVSVSRLILAELTCIRHLVSLFTVHFSRLTMLYCYIALQENFWCNVYDEYSTDFCFDPPMQSSLHSYNNNKCL